MTLTERCFNDVDDLWKHILNHPFINKMADGSLSQEQFRYYMIQDYYYLLRYIDIFSAMLSKADSLEEKQFVSDNIAEVIAELRRVHLPNMKKLGITEEDIEATEVHIDIISYTNYMREVAERGDYLSGLVAILNCSWGYAYIAQEHLRMNGQKIEGSPYKAWFQSYAQGDYIKTNRDLCKKVDDLSKDIGIERVESLSNVFYNCALYDYRLWDMFYSMGKNIATEF